MRFTPMTEEEIAAENLLSPGQYGFEVYKAVDTKSERGNEMVKLTLRVFKDNGGFVFVDDYLLEAMRFKLIHAAKACGLYNKYMQGTLHSQDFLGRSGQVKIKIESDETGKYDDKNAVKDYVVPKESSATAAPSVSSHEAQPFSLDDDIPF